jgi:hypothetical protein
VLLGIDRETCFPVNEVSYAAIRLAAKDTLAQLAAQLDHDPGQADDKVGYLGAVELLQSLTTQAQLRLLGDAWARHRAAHAHQGTFLDAAVVYAACETAADLIRQSPEVAREYLAGAPRRVFFPVSKRLADRIEETFKDVFWQEVDMLRGDAPWPQTDAEMAQAETDLRLPEGSFKPLLDALTALAGEEEAIDPRLDQLLGVLTPEEVCLAAALLEVEVPEHLLPS